MIHYTVSVADANAHHFEVVCTVPHPDPAGQTLSLPAWIPGSYMIRDFSRNILWIKAVCDGQPVSIEKIDKQQWHTAPCGGPLTLTWCVYAWDLSVRSAHLDQTHGFFNGTSLFLAIEGQAAEPHQVTLNLPLDHPNWRVATTLPTIETDIHGWGEYQCESYNALIDHPVEMGTFDRIEFSVCGTPHAMVLTGHHHADLSRLAEDLTRICEHHTRFFGDTTPPVDQYLFQTLVVGDGYGGLEHRDSCALICSRNDLPRKGEEHISEGYRKFLGLCSHEYFHLWNIKRIKPAAFTPYQLDAETYTRQLWAYEGITSYFDDLALLQCGLISRESYLELLGQTLSRIEQNRGKEIQTVTDSSFDAWNKFYKQDENANNAIVSYYAKGAVIALMIDLYLRQQSDGETTLQQVMQQLWNQYGKQGIGTEEQTIEQRCHQAAGGEIPFLSDALYTTQPLLVEPLLKNLGIDWGLRPATSQQNSGGTTADQFPQSWLGAHLTPSANGGLQVSRVTDTGPAQQAGIAAGDRLIALDQLQVSELQVKNCLTHQSPGQTIHLHLFRRDELMEVDLVLAAPPEDRVVLTTAPEIDPTTLSLRQQWLGDDPEP